MDGQWRQVEELFHAAMEQSPDQRAAFLNERCGDNAELRARVENLLAHSQDTDMFQPAIAALSRSASSTTIERFGPWRVQREIGRGGMGAVYLASRDDGAYEALAAIKFIHPGLDSEAVLGRFRQERQILANLHHPHIARLLDGSVDDNGRPFIVMEYVEGQQIVEYSSSHNLSIRQRVELFRSVCAAIHYAHQNMVVHRDVKPGNILVTKDGTPKLLDFGIAKLMEAESGSETGVKLTTMARAMTPDYASPEQVRGAAVNTLTDVYSLGAVLYELLSGKRPHQLNGYSQGELERAICEAETAKPSSHGNTEIEGDLDTIVLKAMQKEPERRYASAAQLSDDLQRYLDGQPVVARPDDFWYLASKFVRRNRTAVVASALVMASLIAGIAATTWQKRVADENARRADRRFAQVRKLANTFLFEFHEKIKALPGATEARALVVKTALEYLDSLSAESGGDSQLQTELATAYEAIAEIQSARGYAGLGRSKDAAASREKALKLRESLAAMQPDDPQTMRALIKSYASTADLADRMGDGERNTKLSQKAADTADRLLKRSSTAADHIVAADAYAKLGRLYQGSKLDEALRLYRSSLDHLKQAVALESTPDGQNTTATAHARYANALGIKGKTAEAEENFRQAVTIREGLVKQHPLNRNYRHGLMNLYAYIGMSTANELRENYDEDASLANYRRALSVAEDIQHRDPKDATARYDVAVMAALTGGMLSSIAPLEGVQLYKRAIAILSELSAADPSNRDYPVLRATQLMYLSELYISARQPDNALSALQQSTAALQQELKLRPGSKTLERDLLIGYRKTGAVHLFKREYSAAVKAYQHALSYAGDTPLPKLGITQLQQRGDVHLGLAKAWFGLNDRAGGCRAAALSAAIWSELTNRGKPAKAVLDKLNETKDLAASCGSSKPSTSPL